jgi:hypothetical protein
MQRRRHRAPLISVPRQRRPVEAASLFSTEIRLRGGPRGPDSRRALRLEPSLEHASTSCPASRRPLPPPGFRRLLDGRTGEPDNGPQGISPGGAYRLAARRRARGQRRPRLDREPDRGRRRGGVRPGRGPDRGGRRRRPSSPATTRPKFGNWRAYTPPAG